MDAAGLNTKYKQLTEYLRDINFKEEDQRQWISESNLENLTTKLFNVIKLNNDDNTYKNYLKLTYALLYLASNAMTMKDIDFDTALLISYKREFNIKSTFPINTQMANLLYEQNILIKPHSSYTEEEYFIQIDNTKCISDETHIKYKNSIVVVRSSQKHEYSMSTYHISNIWFNLYQDAAIGVHELDDYLRWLSDEDVQRLLFIFFLNVDTIISENIFEYDDIELTKYFNLVKQILIRNTKIQNIAQKIDTALMLNMPLVPLIEQFTQEQVELVDIPEITFES